MKPARSLCRLLAAGLLLSGPVEAAVRVRPVRSQPSQAAAPRALPLPESQRPIRLSGHDFRIGAAPAALSPPGAASREPLVEADVPSAGMVPETVVRPASGPPPLPRPFALRSGGAPGAERPDAAGKKPAAVPALGGRTGAEAQGAEEAGRAALSEGDAAAGVLALARAFDGSAPRAASVAFRVPAHSASDGFGDAMAALALARSFKGLHPAASVRLVLEAEGHQEKFKFLFPEVPAPALGEVEVEFSARGPTEGWPWLPPTGADVSVNRMSAGYFAGFGQDPVNIYVGEPGGRRLTDLPAGYEYGKAYMDDQGNAHVFLPAGLHEQEVGLAIDEALAPRISAERAPREALMAELRRLRPDLPLDAARPGERWGFVYLHEEEGHSRPWGEMYLDVLRDAAEEGLFAGERVRVFDFSAARWEPVYVLSWWRNLVIRALRPLRPLIRLLPERARRHLDGPAFTHAYASGHVFPGSDHPNVEVVHVGNVPHDLLIRFLREADLPVVVTGTRSLEEAISLRKRFFYQVVPWKEDLYRGLLARALLELPEEDALRVTALLGVSNWVGLRRLSPAALHDWMGKNGVSRSMALARASGRSLLLDPAYQRSFDAFLDLLHSAPRAGEGLADAMRQAFTMREDPWRLAEPR